MNALNGRCIFLFGAFWSDNYHNDGQLLSDIFDDDDMKCPLSAQEDREIRLHLKFKQELKTLVSEIAELMPGIYGGGCARSVGGGGGWWRGVGFHVK